MFKNHKLEEHYQQMNKYFISPCSSSFSHKPSQILLNKFSSHQVNDGILRRSSCRSISPDKDSRYNFYATIYGITKDCILQSLSSANHRRAQYGVEIRHTNATATSSRRTLLTSVVNPERLGLSPLSYVVKWVPRKLDLIKPQTQQHSSDHQPAQWYRTNKTTAAVGPENADPKRLLSDDGSKVGLLLGGSQHVIVLLKFNCNFSS